MQRPAQTPNDRTLAALCLLVALGVFLGGAVLVKIFQTLRYPFAVGLGALLLCKACLP